MSEDIRASGYTSVIMVMDLRPFIHPDDRDAFETLRGYRSFADVLREDWAQRLTMDKRSAFRLVDEDLAMAGRSAAMSTDEVGFVTGVFRSNVLDLYSAPVYVVDKSKFEFPQAVRDNLQYKNFFAPAWRQWEIFIRPTMTGMLVFHLKRTYAKPRDLLKIATDVRELQTPFDIPSALKVIDDLRVRLADASIGPQQEADYKKKRSDTIAFLDWLGVTDIRNPELDYIPVQWQMALEIATRFVSSVGEEIHFNDGRMLRFNPERTDLSSSLYDSYTIYHMDELVADTEMITPIGGGGGEAEVAEGDESDTQELHLQLQQKNKHSIRVEPSDIKRSIRIKWCLVGLIEGAVLSRTIGGSDKRPKETRYRFPRHNLDLVSRVFEQDIATWHDELCMLTGRVAIIMPSLKASKERLFVSKLDAKNSTAFVEYTRYWEALERLIEFVVEIGLLAQLVENTSADILQQFVRELDHARKNILAGQLNGSMQNSQRSLTLLTNQAANLSRLMGVCQGLSNPNFWSYAEYAVEKANHLMQQMQITVLMQHAERNVSNLTNLVDHVDEIYLAQLSERSNEQNSRQSIILAGLSLTIILFTLPSFWADITALDATNNVVLAIQGTDFLGALAVLGSLLAPFIFCFSVLMLLLVVIPTRYKFWRRRAHR